MVTKEEPENSSSTKDVGGEESEVEEGEIVAGNSEDAEILKAMAPPPPMHPLEHAWTFWFDNPSAKQKQAAWGSSMRPIYTFSTVEDFWRFLFFLDLFVLKQYLVFQLFVDLLLSAFLSFLDLCTLTFEFT